MSLLYLVGAAFATVAVARDAAAQDAEQPPAEDEAPPPAQDETPAPARAAVADAEPEAISDSQRERAHFLAWYAPAPVEAPALRLPEPITRLYLDGSYVRSDDLSALPFIEGKANNLRFALGGSLRLGRWALEAELPCWQVTTLDVTKVPGPDGPETPIPQDEHQTALSIGDLRLGATWSRPLPVESLYLVAGAGLRVRAPSHTTIFQFHLIDGSLAQYRFPYYFHVEPTAILGGAVSLGGAGRLAFVVNEGLLLLTGPDGDFGPIHVIVPNVLFFSAHYAVVWSPIAALGFSADLATDIQLNHVDALNFERLNDIVAVSLDGGLQVHADAYRIDLVWRSGLTRGADLFGVLQYAGTQGVTLRLSRHFN